MVSCLRASLARLSLWTCRLTLLHIQTRGSFLNKQRGNLSIRLTRTATVLREGSRGQQLRVEERMQQAHAQQVFHCDYVGDRRPCLPLSPDSTPCHVMTCHVLSCNDSRYVTMRRDAMPYCVMRCVVRRSGASNISEARQEWRRNHRLS